MKRLTVQAMGAEVQGIRLRGDRRDPEPTHVRIVFPGGDVDVVRTEGGDYWIHVRVDSESDVAGEAAERPGELVDARLDIRGKAASAVHVGDFKRPEPLPPGRARGAQRSGVMSYIDDIPTSIARNA